MYRNSGKQHARILLWGAPGSLWTGRTLAYVIKKGIEYQEIFPSNARFMEEIVPLVGYFASPVTEPEDGTLFQDGTDTMMHLEQRFPDPSMIPGLPLRRTVTDGLAQGQAEVQTTEFDNARIKRKFDEK